MHQSDMERYSERTEELLNMPYYVIDILPRRVPAERADAWFAAERTFLEPERIEELYGRFGRVVLKLGCYYDLAVCTAGPGEEGRWVTMSPEELAGRIGSSTSAGWLNLLVPDEDTLITLNGGDLYMTLYHPSANLLKTVRLIAEAEGLFVRFGETADELRVRTRAAEEKAARVFSTRIPFSEHLSRWVDDALPDKYDHNAFEYSGQPTREEFQRALEHQRARGDGFIKLEGDEPLKDAFGLEGGVTLTMVLREKTAEWKTNPALVFACPAPEEIEEFEAKHYGPLYGEDFSRRNIRRLYEKLEYHGAYLDDVLVGACYTFSSDGMTCIDGLTVDESYRHRYIATSLLAHLADRYSGDLLYLHADEDETPKEMYRKMGFETVDRLYEYLNTDIRSAGLS